MDELERDEFERTRTSFRDFLHAVFKRKTLMILFFMATVCIVTLATLLAKPTYEATSQVLVKIGRENLYLPTMPAAEKMNPVINVNREEQINSEIEILKSPSLIEQVVETLGPTTIYESLNHQGRSILSKNVSAVQGEERPLHKAVLKIQKDLTVEGVVKSNVIEINFKHTDPRIAATVVNTLVNLYLDRHLVVHKTPQSYNFFQQQSRILRTKLRQAEGELEAFKKEHKITSLDEERELLLEQEGNLKADLNQTHSQIAETENRILELQRQLAATPKTVAQEEEIEHSPMVINTLQARLVELQLNERELLTKYADSSRLVKNVRDEIRIVQDKLAEHDAKRYGKTKSGLNLTYQRLQEELLSSQAELKALKGKRKTQTAQLAEYRDRLGKLNRIEVKLNELKRQVEVDEQSYRLYLTKFEESRISDAMDTERIANVTQIQPARPPLKPVSPKVMLNLVLGIFLGGLGAFGLALLMNHLDDSLEKPDDTKRYLKTPVAASIPELTHGFLAQAIEEVSWRPLIPVTRPAIVVPQKEYISRSRRKLSLLLVLPAASLVAACFLIFAMDDYWKTPALSTGKNSPSHSILEERFPRQPSLPDKLSLPTSGVAYAQSWDLKEDEAISVSEEAPDPHMGKTDEQLHIQKIPALMHIKQNKTERVVPLATATEFKPKVRRPDGPMIQVGAFRNRKTAEHLMAKLREQGHDVYLAKKTLKDSGFVHRVRIGGYATIAQARASLTQLRKCGFNDAFIIPRS